MKILNKIKKVFVGIGIFFITIYTKVLAASDSLATQLMYGVPPDQNDSIINVRGNIWRIISYIIIPLVTIIGAIIYWKKSKSSTRRKVLTLLIIVILVVLLIIFLANNFIN